MKKILVVCTSGLGTSLALRLVIEKFVRENNIKATVEHTDIGSANFMGADLIVGAKQVVNCLPIQNHAETVALEDIVNHKYIRQMLMDCNTIKEWIWGKEE
ncbi:PTS sugar transporter subunit IIB [Alkalicella caledoniensis]|uniref:PTS sugar transporter subunit IIB n=1 Tax=Alkalicella caledoniensis TaxID=2731377 RepID=A0A7G9WAT8_ALKCA|nr:PTS sugar transporter subunit IIB [Alkalicella caledoniensis]QNO15800.1 PTS sugar transporter subunit IIB [Alkalicella caledoniensis]